MPSFLIDENVPITVLEALMRKGFEAELVPTRLRNSQIASSAIRQGRIIITDDADFLMLRKDLQMKAKIILIRVHPPDPVAVTHLVESYLDECVELLKTVNSIQLTEKGPVSR